MRTYNTPVAAWHRSFYTTRTGAPTIKEFKAAIDEGIIPGGCILGKYHITTDANGNPAYDTLNTAQKPPRIIHPVALRILKKHNIDI